MPAHERERHKMLQFGVSNVICVYVVEEFSVGFYERPASALGSLIK